MNSHTKSIISTFVLAVALVVTMVIIPQTLGLGRTGFDSADVLKQWFFYVGPGIGFLLGVLLLFGLEYVIRAGDATYGSGVAFASQGELPAASIFKRLSLFQIFLGSLLIFGIFFSVITYVNPQISFTGTYFLKQQFTAVDSLIFSAGLIPSSENLGAAFLIAFLIVLIRMYARRGGWGKANFTVLCYMLIPITVGLIGVANHTLRYSGSDVALMTVFVFWTLGGFVTLFTGSFIPFFVIHLYNNLFLGLNTFFSYDNIIVYVGIYLVILLAMYLGLYVFRKRRKEK
jgi:hypothetical protein